MLFLVTQTHTPDLCPKDEGGSRSLYDASVDGVTVRGIYGAFAEHTVYYLVEADDLKAVQKLLLPGFKRCACDIVPVSEEPIVK